LRSLAGREGALIVSTVLSPIDEGEMERPVYFISDAHLGSSSDPRSDDPRLSRIIPFLRHVADRRAEHLYILGDLFDFWFEYRHVMPWRHFHVLAEIARVVESGVPVTFLGGNHDWWVGRVFHEVTGMTVRRESFSVQHQGKRIFLAHGDGLSSKGESGYLLMRKVLRHPWTIRMLRFVHPDLAYSFGHRFSKFSREHLTDREFTLDATLIRTIDEVLARGHDAFLMGHLHVRHQERRPGGGTLYILGDWMRLYSALRLEGGAFVWEDWSECAPHSVADPAPTLSGGH
jgi:UDP-2,3-diacylglucosamine hydrolase